MKYNDKYIYLHRLYTYVHICIYIDMCMIFFFMSATYFKYFITQNIFWKVWYVPEFGMWKNYEKIIVPAFSWSSHSAEVVPSLVRLIRCWGLGSLVHPASYIPSSHTRKIRRILDLTFDLLWKIVCPASISPMSSSFATCTWAVWRLDVKWCLNCLEWAILGEKICQ